MSELSFYRKEGTVFVFDQIGNCFEVVNLYDQFETGQDNVIVDKEHIRSPLPGVISRIEVSAGDKIKKVLFLLKLGICLCLY